MPGTECGSLHDLCWPYQSIWHSQSWGTLENYGKVWLFCQIHSNCVAVPDAFQDGDNGIPMRYRFDGKLFNLRRLQAKSKVQTEVLDEFLFADNMAKGVPTEEKMQKGVDQVSDSCDSYDLTISIKKTEVAYQPAPGKPYKEPTITVKGQRLQVVDKFTYLGSTLSRVVHIDDEVNARIAKASAAFGRLLGSIWDRSGIRLDT